MTIVPYILLVDDEPFNLVLLEELLALEGYQTRSAQSGAEALEIAQVNPPELIILDVMMPEMDGFEVCEHLRSHPRLQTIPILFLTALDDDRSRLRGLESMGDDYFCKPIQTHLVLTKIKSLLRLSQLRQQSQQRRLAEQAEEFQRRQAELQRYRAAADQTSATLSRTLRVFVPEQFLNHLAPNGIESMSLTTTTTTDVTIVFCDIRDFTAIAETQSPEVTFTWLNAFYAQVNQAIADHHGFVDKYIGDAVMAVFDRPQRHTVDGLNAALAIDGVLQAFNQQRQQYGLHQPVRIGMGVHTGKGVIGTLGDSQRMDPTVVGDVVNTTARIEEMTKAYDCQILVSDSVLGQLPADHAFCFRWLDRVTPRGKQAHLELYQLISAEAQSTPSPSRSDSA